MGYYPYAANSGIVPPLVLSSATANAPMFGVNEPGDTANRLELRAGGVMAVGPGSSTPTVTLGYLGGGGLNVVSTTGIKVAGGALDVSTAGQGLKVAEGSNAKQGTTTLVAGTVVVANTSVTAASRIFLSNISPGGTAGFLVVSAISAGTSFTILSSNVADTSVIAYEIFESG